MTQNNPDQSESLIDDQTVLAILTGQLDRGSDMPLGAQLRGAIENCVAGGLLPAGTRLPSIRTLARSTALAAETVATAYRTLQRNGVLVSYQGSGTFVSDAKPTSSFAAGRSGMEAQIDGLLDLAGKSGLGVGDLLSLIRSRHAVLAASRGMRLVMVGIFEEATQAYARDIATYLRPGDQVDAITIDQLGTDAVATPSDLYVSLPSRLPQVKEIVGERAPVTSVSVIPSERTRNFLASLDPNARVALVARFATFMPLMKSGAEAFAPHVRGIEVMALDDPALDEKLRGADTIVYSTGAEEALRRAGVNVASAEYRHTPDPHAIRDTLIPLVDSLRRGPARIHQLRPAARKTR